MTSLSSSAVRRKKRGRGKREEASTSEPAFGVHEPKQRKKRVQRDGS
jgi:hypothetical protein